MAANDITISDLTFEGIKKSLIEYLKKQETFKDYNFEGSAIRTLVDLLAYNTFYYGYYSNMIANEMFLDTAKLQNSMISLTKPLGYVIHNYLSAKSTLRLNNITSINSELSAFSSFRGNDPAGRPYYFYNIRSIPVGANEDLPGSYRTPFFEVYEGKALVRRQLVNVDLNTQTFSLPDLFIDPRTITIEVGDVNGKNLTVWNSYYLNPDTVIGSETEIFFTERTKNGYNINFGKFTSNDVGGQSNGKQIIGEDTVYVSYLISSGADGNGVANITFLRDAEGKSIKKETTVTEVSIASRNGTSSPDLDEIRFFAPKTFASQNRIVTKNDYYSVLNSLGYGSGSSPEFGYKVFGGEEATPPIYGRVFVSIMDLNPGDAKDYSKQNEINEVLSVLKDKSVVSILPEYLAPFDVNMKLIVVTNHRNVRSAGTVGEIVVAVRNALRAEYGTKKYDRNVQELDISQIARDAYPGLNIVSVFLEIRAISPQVSDKQGRKINLKNPIESLEITGFEDSTQVARNAEKYIYLYKDKSLVSDMPVGELDTENGIITIYPNITANRLIISVKVPKNVFIAKDEIVCYLDADNDLTITVV
jgi:hypothetical protein